MIHFAIEVQGKKKTTDREIRHLENEIEVSLERVFHVFGLIKENLQTLDSFLAIH